MQALNLVDHARKHQYAKRGGGAIQVPLDEIMLARRANSLEVLVLDEAVASLSMTDSRKGRVVELRYFSGLTLNEIAEVIPVSPETVMRDWKIAKACLTRELARTGNAAKELGPQR